MLGDLTIGGLLWGLTKGIPRGIAALFGATLGPWGELVTDLLFVGGWIVAHTVPVHSGKTAAEYAQWYYTNALDNLSDGGPRHEFEACPVGNTPAAELPTARICAACLAGLPTDLAEDRPRDDANDKNPYSWDVTVRATGVLRQMQPIEFQGADDLAPITLDRLIEVGTLRNGAGQEVALTPRTAAAYAAAIASYGKHEGHLSWDDDLGQHLGRGERPGTVYGRVLWAKQRPDLLYLQYVHVRAGSWLPTRHFYPFSWEHIGDGEMATVVVVLDRAQRTCTPIGTLTGGHSRDRDCGGGKPTWGVAQTHDGPPSATPPIRFERDDAGRLRPALFIGYGSHAIAPDAGRRAAGGGTTDWYFGPPEVTGVVPSLVHMPHALDLARLVFTEQVWWGGYGGHTPIRYWNDDTTRPEGCTCDADNLLPPLESP